MKIIGCDFHPSFQQIAMVDTDTGEQTERRVTLAEAAEFYRGLPAQVRVGMEGCGNTLWFEHLLAELGHELWLGDAGRIRAVEVRKQKTDRRDAELLLRLMLENRFPRLWVPNQLQHLALNQGVQQKHKLWTRAGRKLLGELPLEGWTARRREQLLELLDDGGTDHATGPGREIGSGERPCS
jgi:transposase